MLLVDFNGELVADYLDLDLKQKYTNKFDKQKKGPIKEYLSKLFLVMACSSFKQIRIKAINLFFLNSLGILGTSLGFIICHKKLYNILHNDM